MQRGKVGDVKIGAGAVEWMKEGSSNSPLKAPLDIIRSALEQL